MREVLRSLLSRTGLLPVVRTARKAVVRRTPAFRAKVRRVRERRRRLAELYGSLVSPGDLCFDVGANVGVRVGLLRALGARVVAVEPHPECRSILRRKFTDDPEVTLVEAGLGAAEGEQELFLSSDLETSSMSREWIDSVSDRLEDHAWEQRRTVRVTTLDALIAAHGVPDFCKIDVEGFELEVLRGLSTPIPRVSFEYTPERLEPAFACIDRLTDLGTYRFALSPAEDFTLGDDAWGAADDVKAELLRLRDSGRSGDVYARADGADGVKSL